MNPVATWLTWPMISAENALKTAWAVYASVTAFAIAVGVWTVAKLPHIAGLPSEAWAAGAVLGGFGAWRVRVLQARLSARRRVTPIWPFAVIALVGLGTNLLYAVMLVIGLFEILQARYVLDLAPLGSDRSHS